MGAAGHRVGGQAGCPVGVQATWRLTPVVWCSPEWSSGLSCQVQQGMGVPSMINRGPGSRSSAVEAFSAGAAAIGGRLGGQDSGDGGLGDCERFGEGLLSEVVAQAGQNESDAPVGAEPA